MTISFNDVTGGMGLLIDGQVYIVLDYQHVKPGKGAAFTILLPINEVDE